MFKVVFFSLATFFSAQGVCQRLPPPQAHEAQSSASVTESQIDAPGSQALMNSMAEGGMTGRSLLTPAGVMVGKAGQWMASYQFLFDDMNGNLSGTNSISNTAVLQRFGAVPTAMTMQMHMGMVMYSATDRLTLVAMVPFMVKNMDHVARDGTRFTEHTGGIGDIELHGIYSLYATNDVRHRFLINAGLGLPSGSIGEAMGGMRLEYPMQLGSGTVSLQPGVTYLGQVKRWGWGADFIPTVRVGRNSNGYRLGNRYEPSVWVARQLSGRLAVSARARRTMGQYQRCRPYSESAR